MSEQAFPARLRFGSYARTVQELVDSGVLLHLRPAGVSGPDVYGYTCVATADTFAIQAFPDTPGVTGDRYFYVDQSGMIRQSSTGPATALSAALD